MSENWPHFGSEDHAESDEAGSPSVNGANPEDAVPVSDGSIEGTVASLEAAVAATDEAADGAADETPTADESPAATEVIGEASPAGASDDAAATSDDAAATSAEPAEVDEGSAFVTELVRAMQTTAGIERVRTGEDTERRRQAYIDGVRAREASEADRMRELAADDMKAIEAWAEGETKRIQLERERRASELNKDLEASLSEHHAKIDREIETVETAIATYRTEVATFFERLDRETDPILIAQHAAGRPAFPPLEAVVPIDAASPPPAADENPVGVATDASSPPPVADNVSADIGTAAPAEATVIGVMDPEAAAEPVESWTAPAETSPESATGAESAQPAEPAELMAVATGSSQGSSEPLLQSVPIHRPMSWLRRDANGGGDRSNHDD